MSIDPADIIKEFLFLALEELPGDPALVARSLKGRLAQIQSTMYQLKSLIDRQHMLVERLCEMLEGLRSVEYESGHAAVKSEVVDSLLSRLNRFIEEREKEDAGDT